MNTTPPEINLLSVAQLQEKIELLSTTEEGDHLKNAMDDLKKALKANPAACALLLPEDIGKAVAVLRKITDKEIIEDIKGAKKPKKEKAQLDLNDPNVLNDILENL